MKLDLFSFDSFSPFFHIEYKEFDKAGTLVLGHFTTSIFLDKILENGLQPPAKTGKYSNDDMIVPGDEHYIYLAAHYDNVFSKNAVERYGGDQILILIEIDKSALELDDLNQKYSKENVNLKDQEELHKALTQNIFAQCRTKTEIRPSQIVKALQLPSKKIIFER